MRSLTAIHGVEPLAVGLQGQPQGDNPDVDMAGAQDTIYLCNFRVSVDGEWLCLKELHDMDAAMQDSYLHPSENNGAILPVNPMHSLMGNFIASFL